MKKVIFDGNRFLIVDDDRDMLELIPMMLQTDFPSAVFLGARDGEEALTVFEGADPKPGIIILDMMLPKRSGFLVYEKIRQFHKPPLPLVLMITGNMGQRHKVHAQQLGIDEYLLKPFRKEKLIVVVQRMMVKMATIEAK